MLRQQQHGADQSGQHGHPQPLTGHQPGAAIQVELVAQLIEKLNGGGIGHWAAPPAQIAQKAHMGNESPDQHYAHPRQPYSSENLGQGEGKS